MLVIRNAQLEALVEARLREFEDQLARELETGDRPAEHKRDARALASRAVRTCIGHGIDRECDVREFLELMLRLGPGFEERPELGACSAILANPELQGPTKLLALKSRLSE